jgi:TonB family protein
VRENRKIILVEFFLLIFVFFLSEFKLYSQETNTKVIVIRDNAEVRLFPTEKSAVFKKLPIGTVLDVESTKGEWFKIVLPPEDGFVIKGYILKSMVVEAVEKAPEVKEEKPDKESKEEVRISTVILKDGSTIKGKLLSETKDSIEIEAKFGKIQIKREQILEIKQQPKPNEEKPDDPGSKKRIEETKKIEDEEVKGKVKKIEELTRSEEPIAVNKPPRVIKKINPKYPRRAVERKIEGLVVLEVKIDKFGKIQDVKVIKSFPVFDKEAIEAVRQWVYEPMIINGIPRAVVFTVKLRFEIGK